MIITIPIGLVFLFVAWLVLITVYPAGQREPAHRLTRHREPERLGADLSPVSKARVIRFYKVIGVISLICALIAIAAR
jgi:di/tricarboxylate transporter